MAKIDMMALGIGRKPAAESAPPRFGAKPEAEPDPMDPAEGEAGDTDGDLTPDMLLYHGADSNCGSCSHFTAPTTCDRWPDPVEDGGWCRGWQSGAGAGGESGAGADLGALSELGAERG